MSQISVVIMACNEESNIVDAIASAKFASQIVVADTGSQDKTMDLARRAGAEVHSICFDGYGASKNRALEFARHEWVFSLDADERISPELAENIKRTIECGLPFDGYAVSRMTYFLGKPIRHSGWYPDYVLRFFRRGKGRFAERLVHETVSIDGSTSKLEGLLYHYSYKNLESYLDKMNTYSSLNAKELHRQGKSGSLWDILIHPPATFIKMFILRAGFLDGFYGFLLASLSSFHVLIKYAKLYRLGQQREPV